jgi:hypothetical protein
MSQVLVQQTPNRIRIIHFLVISLLLHLFVLSLFSVNPVARWSLPTVRKNTTPELKVSLRLAVPASKRNQARHPLRRAITAELPVPAQRLPDKAARPKARPQVAPRISAEQYRQLQSGTYVREFMQESFTNKELARRFESTGPAISFRLEPSRQRSSGRILKEEKFRDGNVRVSVRGLFGKKRCFEARPDDPLDEFDLGGFFLAVVAGC